MALLTLVTAPLSIAKRTLEGTNGTAKKGEKQRMKLITRRTVRMVNYE